MSYADAYSTSLSPHWEVMPGNDDAVCLLTSVVKTISELFMNPRLSSASVIFPTASSKADTMPGKAKYSYYRV